MIIFSQFGRMESRMTIAYHIASLCLAVNWSFEASLAVWSPAGQLHIATLHFDLVSNLYSRKISWSPKWPYLTRAFVKCTINALQPPNMMIMIIANGASDPWSCLECRWSFQPLVFLECTADGALDPWSCLECQCSLRPFFLFGIQSRWSSRPLVLFDNQGLWENCGKVLSE